MELTVLIPFIYDHPLSKFYSVMVLGSSNSRMLVLLADGDAHPEQPERDVGAAVLHAPGCAAGLPARLRECHTGLPCARLSIYVPLVLLGIHSSFSLLR